MLFKDLIIIARGLIEYYYILVTNIRFFIDFLPD